MRNSSPAWRDYHPDIAQLQALELCSAASWIGLDPSLFFFLVHNWSTEQPLQSQLPSPVAGVLGLRQRCNFHPPPPTRTPLLRQGLSACATRASAVKSTYLDGYVSSQSPAGLFSQGPALSSKSGRFRDGTTRGRTSTPQFLLLKTRT